MELTNKYAKLLATRITGNGEKHIEEKVEICERSDSSSMGIPTETQCEIKPFTVPPTCDRLDSIPKNVHYITKAEPNTSFIVVIDAEPHIENPDCLRRQILGGLHVYIDDGNEEYSISKLRGNWPYNYKYNKEGGWDLEECESFTGESLVGGFFDRLMPLTYMNGNLVYEHKGEQFRLQLTNKTYMHFSYYCYNYTTKVKIKKDFHPFKTYFSIPKERPSLLLDGRITLAFSLQSLCPFPIAIEKLETSNKERSFCPSPILYTHSN